LARFVDGQCRQQRLVGYAIHNFPRVRMTKFVFVLVRFFEDRPKSAACGPMTGPT